MSLTKQWKTTKRPDGPTGYKRAGTFRDISIRFSAPEFIDDFDYVCQTLEINRSELMERMQKTANYYPLQHLEENVPYDPDGTREKMRKAMEARGKMPKGGKVYTFEEFHSLNLLSNNHS